ncbi:Gfo/Idh/MocA family protein [Herbiconiux sp. UC225_62]|uniref:Gfo/Idh/MocA family protein n=1 Tax=Herbiconiux sp. UC225_62 TaxID=3350168 RepID=UPI0036D39968
MMQRGVGVIGAGPGVSALHLPTLERLSALFRVAHVSDSGSGRAAELADRVGARSSAGIEGLLADPAVEVVAVCSPPDQHAAQVLAAVRAGKKGVLCEKPLATTPEEAEAVIEACQAAGTVLVVGTNHAFDPAWTRAKHHLLANRGRPQSWTVTIALPPNGRYHDAVTESAPPSAAGARPLPDWSNPQVAAAVVRQLVLGLAVHDLPALRDFAPRVTEVVFAEPISPIGYRIGLLAGDVLVQLNAVMLPGGADALWRLSIGLPFDDIDVDFLPAFVHAGSADVTVRQGDGQVTRYPLQEDDGYLMEWRALAAALDDDHPGDYGELLDDALFAIRIADAAAEAVRKGMAS